LFFYEDIKAEANEIKVKNINAYLVEGNDFFLQGRTKPICNVNEISFGSMPNDGGGLIISNEERSIALEEEPLIEKYIVPLIGAQEFLNGGNKWCLWLKDAKPDEIKKSRFVNQRLNIVKEHRNKSKRPTTKELANYPSLFGEDRQPKSNYICMPRVSSENRKYIPVAFFSNKNIIGDTCLAIDNATFYEFGILNSATHMTWVKYVGGRLKSDFRYSNTILYNNFPWPEGPTEKQKQAVEKAAQQVLDARLQFPTSSLADLYDPLTMPPALVKAHNALDKAVDLCYRSQPFINETKRIEFLFELYDKYTSGLFVKEKKGRKK
jgi:hypothetical protein